MNPGPSAVDSRDEWVDAIHAAIAGRGYALLPAIGQEEWDRRISSLGVILDTTSVELNPAIGTYLCQPGEVPMHSDHPDAELIAWRCERADPQGTPQLVCDSLSVVGALDDAARRILTQTRVVARFRSRAPAMMFPILRQAGGGWRLFFAPWLEPESGDVLVREAWRQLVEAVERSRESCLEVRLGAGEILLIDNGRMLHGRPPLAPESSRCLVRTWLRAHR